ncbi:hypothetical protein BSF38_00352 [Paludisphaera borealis]|uniref:Uncharacterized protein n=1 Tax=Paludisphaera borealis TaxID=1387353 RepID=A0A1U7CJ19_9BACT|nr:hypothetical protein BSF38_00352 [Paludisphaera borealis]
MSRRLAIALAASCVINIVLLVVGRGSFGQIIAMIFALGLAVISVGIGFLTYLVARLAVEAPALRRFARRAVILGLVAGSSLVSLPIGSLVNGYDMGQAKSFCDRLRPALKRHRQATGRYPETVSKVTTRDQLPWLLRGEHFYFSSSDGYSFLIRHQWGMLDGVASDSSSAGWREFD